MVVESSFATRLPVADGFKAIGRDGEAGLGGQRGGRRRRRPGTMAKRRTKPIHG